MKPDPPPDDPPDERRPGPKRYPLWVAILRGFFFLLALGFTCASLIYLNAGNEGRMLTVFLSCLGGTLLLAFLGMFKSTIFEALLLVIAAFIFLSTIYFEFRDDLSFLKTPEQVTDSVVVAELPGNDSIRAVRFRDARVVLEDTVLIPDPDSYGSFILIAPIVDTWRDIVRGDSVFGFVTGYSYSADFSYQLEQWMDSCNTGIVESYKQERNTAYVAEWKNRKGRAVSSSPVFIYRTCYLSLNDGGHVGDIIGVFVFLYLAWLVIVSIVRGITVLLNK